MFALCQRNREVLVGCVWYVPLVEKLLIKLIGFSVSEKARGWRKKKEKEGQEKEKGKFLKDQIFSE